MGLFNDLFGGHKKEPVVVEAPPCPHSALTPRWDSVSDMGKDDLATRFVCEGCHQEFTPDQARELRTESVTGRLIYQDAEERDWSAPNPTED